MDNRCEGKCRTLTHNKLFYKYRELNFIKMSLIMYSTTQRALSKLLAAGNVRQSAIFAKSITTSSADSKVRCFILLTKLDAYLLSQSNGLFGAKQSGILTATNLNAVNVRTVFNESQYANRAQYGGRFMVTVLPGDGIGPEMITHVRKIFK